MNIPYRIVKIENNQFALFPDKYVNGQEVKIDVSFNFAYSKDLDMIRCVAMIHYSQSSNNLVILENTTYFSIAPEGIHDIKKEGRIPVDFLRYMATISVGTARGIIHAKTEGTVLNSVVLPPINLVEIIKDDMVINNQ